MSNPGFTPIPVTSGVFIDRSLITPENLTAIQREFQKAVARGDWRSAYPTWGVVKDLFVFNITNNNNTTTQVKMFVFLADEQDPVYVIPKWTWSYMHNGQRITSFPISVLLCSRDFSQIEVATVPGLVAYTMKDVTGSIYFPVGEHRSIVKVMAVRNGE